MINSVLLKSRAKMLGITQREIAEAMGVKQSSANLKINNRRPLTLQEAEILAELLQIGNNAFGTYFFWHPNARAVRVKVRRARGRGCRRG